MMEEWNDGRMEHWNDGMMEHWNDGTEPRVPGVSLPEAGEGDKLARG